MSRFYSDPKRESKTYSLPNFEAFEVTAAEFLAAWEAGDGTWMAQVVEDYVNENAPSEDDCDPADVCTHLLSVEPGKVRACGADGGMVHADINFCTCYACNRAHVAYECAQEQAGWYYWPCFPGCMPDGDASGPFETEAEAIADARESYGEE